MRKSKTWYSNGEKELEEKLNFISRKLTEENAMEDEEEEEDENNKVKEEDQEKKRMDEEKDAAFE